MALAICPRQRISAALPPAAEILCRGQIAKAISGTHAAAGSAGTAADVVLWRPIIAAWRSNAAATREVRHTRVAIAQLGTEGDVLVRHVIVGSGGVICRVLIARVLGKVGRSAGGRRSVDGRQQGKEIGRANV